MGVSQIIQVKAWHPTSRYPNIAGIAGRLLPPVSPSHMEVSKNRGTSHIIHIFERTFDYTPSIFCGAPILGNVHMVTP